jgi:hypothetical protein
VFAPCRAARLLSAAALLAVAAAAPAAASPTIVPSPNPGSLNTLGGLVPFSATNVWGVGSASSSSYTGCHGRTLTMRSNAAGTVFGEVFETPAATPICASVNGAAGRSPADIWAVGSTNSARDPHVRHWNGSTWSAGSGAVLPVPPSGGRRLRTTGLNAVAVVPGSSDVWAVGRAQFSDFSRHTLIERWNPGAGWQLVNGPTGAGSALNGISPLGASDVWAVGSAGSGATLATHWNGSGWSTVPTASPSAINTLNAVTAIAPNDVWAVGSQIKSTTDGVSQYRTLVEHYNGTSWTTVPSPNSGTGSNELTGVAALAPNNVWAVGYRLDTSGDIPVAKTLVMRWTGTGWSVVQSPSAGTGDNLLAGAVAAGTGNVWAWGNSAGGTLVMHVAP